MNDDKQPALSEPSASSLAPRFHALFAGHEGAHGTYNNIAQGPTRSDGKRTGTAVTVRQPVTDALWQAHLAGTGGLGVIPIREDDTAMYGAIDIDVYAGLNPGDVASTVAQRKLPLIVCRSKSGGVHMFLFTKEPVLAADIQRRLQEIAALLGYGTAEIFPKQTVIRAKDKDLGSWINMPYFAGIETTRYAVKPDGDALSPEEFLTAAEAAKQPADWFSQTLPRKTDVLPDGPPCLQHLMELGFPEGTWNNGMFNLGVYCRKAQPDNWEAHLIQLNGINFPVNQFPTQDLKGIVKSLTNKNYRYQCNKQPLAQHCDRTTCRRRKYGVGTGGANALPVLSSLTKLCTDPPVWFLEVEGHRMEFNTPDLLNPLVFQQKCANHEIIVPIVKRNDWTEHLRPAMASVNRIPVADDGSDGDGSSAKAHFLALLERFCTGRSQAVSMEETRLGKPFTEGGRTYFNVFDLMTFLHDKGFKDYRRNEVTAVLKDLGACSRQHRVDRQDPEKKRSLWDIPAFARGDKPLPVPPEIKDGDGKPF